MSFILENPPSPTASWPEISARLDLPCSKMEPLSPAERVVLSCLARGLSNREIARILGKAEATVKNQVSACLRKCGTPSRARLIASLR